MTQQEINKRFYLRRKNNGLCPKCGKELDREGYYCSECLIKTNNYAMETRKFFKSIGICPVCRKERLFGEEMQCLECRAKNTNRRNLYITEEKKIIYNNSFRLKQNELYKERIEQGICIRCGKRAATKGKHKCEICLDRDAIAHRIRYVKKEEDIRRLVNDKL